MNEVKKRIASVGMLAAGIILTLVGLAGLVLPIIPGVVLILIGLWMISKVYKSPLLEKILETVKQKRERAMKRILNKENN